MADNNTNGADSDNGIRSIAAAIVFAIVYFPFFLVFIWRRLHARLEAYTVAALYCVGM
jgi:hypothetical protein